MIDDNVIVKKIEGGNITTHPPLFSINGRLVNTI